VDFESFAAYNTRNAAGRRADLKALEATQGRDVIFSDEVPEGVTLIGERLVGGRAEHWCPVHGLEIIEQVPLEEQFRACAPAVRFVRDVYSGLFRPPFRPGTFGS
jgi:hypothetical protein